MTIMKTKITGKTIRVRNKKACFTYVLPIIAKNKQSRHLTVAAVKGGIEEASEALRFVTLVCKELGKADVICLHSLRADCSLHALLEA